LLVPERDKYITK